MAVYYNMLSTGYEQLYGEEQRAKYEAVFSRYPCTPGWRVLDVGHATGRICAWLRECEVLGMDTAGELLKQSPCETLVASMDDPLPFPDSSFDLVTSFTAFHHARHPPFTLGEMLRVARKRLIITLHARLPSTERLRELLLREGFSSFPAGVDIAFIREKPRRE